MEVIKVKELPEAKAERTKREKHHKNRQAMEAAKGKLKSKKFADLTSSEKDDLLKYMAIQLGLIDG